MQHGEGWLVLQDRTHNSSLVIPEEALSCTFPQGINEAGSKLGVLTLKHCSKEVCPTPGPSTHSRHSRAVRSAATRTSPGGCSSAAAPAKILPPSLASLTSQEVFFLVVKTPTYPNQFPGLKAWNDRSWFTRSEVLL